VINNDDKRERMFAPLLAAHKRLVLADELAARLPPELVDPRRHMAAAIDCADERAKLFAQLTTKATSKVAEKKLDALAEISKHAKDRMYVELDGYETDWLAITLEAKDSEISELRKQLGLDPRARS